MTPTSRRQGEQTSNEARFADLYQRYGRLLHAYCLRRTSPSHAADAVAEVFLVAWRRIDRVPEGEGALPWLYAVAYRVVSHQWRTRARSRKLADRLGGLAHTSPPSPELVFLRSEEDRLVIEAANRLKGVEQEILRLTLWEGLSHDDVARALGLKPSALKQRAYRARRNLATEFRKLTKDEQPPTALSGGQR